MINDLLRKVCLNPVAADFVWRLGQGGGLPEFHPKNLF
jgi:hypothetical protein